tara:strand:+ start:680 stop:1081 length:402 start_codon:yes stop_codon:yes gene_type:complete
MKTQLLCTFTTRDNIDKTIKTITNSYEVLFDKIYVFENVDSFEDLMCTYNLDPNNLGNFIPNTISLHRKKQTNSLYTINALNAIIKELNNGVLDKLFQIPWEKFRNCMLVTNDKTGYTKIDTKIYEIIEIKSE